MEYYSVVHSEVLFFLTNTGRSSTGYNRDKSWGCYANCSELLTKHKKLFVSNYMRELEWSKLKTQERETVHLDAGEDIDGGYYLAVMELQWGKTKGILKIEAYGGCIAGMFLVARNCELNTENEKFVMCIFLQIQIFCNWT